MTKIKNRYLSLIVWGLVCVLWNVVVLLLSDLKAVKGSYWSAFAFIDVAFVAIGVLIVLTKLGKNTTLSVYAPQYVFSAIYFGLTFIFNFIFIVAPSSEKILGNLIPNIILIVAYAIAMIISMMGMSHIKANEEHIQNKVQSLKILEVKVSALLYKAKSVEVTKIINELKEKIHYSDPMGTKETAEAEEEIKNQIEVINNLLTIKADDADVISAVEDAIVKVKLRNQLLIAVQ